MKNVFRFIVVVSALCTLLLSCDLSKSGTIVVNNLRATDVSVTVYTDVEAGGIYYSYEGSIGPKTVPAGGSKSFSVGVGTYIGKENSTDCLVQWSDGEKEVTVYPGKDVEVNIK